MHTVQRFGYEFYYSPDIIYFDSATVGKPPVIAIEEMYNFFQTVGGAVAIGTNSEAIVVGKKLSQTREIIASFLGVDKNFVAFSPSRETAFVTWLYSNKYHKNSTIITSSLEENSIVAPLIRAKKDLNLKLTFLSKEDEYDLVSSISNNLTENTSALVLSAVTSAEGIKRDYQAISKLCKDNNIEFVLDISNILGHEPLNLNEALPSLTICEGNRGALGPQGTAFQIYNSDLLEKTDPIIAGNFMVSNLSQDGYQIANDGTRFETGVLNVPGIIALGKSIEILQKISPEKIEAHERQLFEKLEKGLKELDKIILLRSEGLKYGAILSFYVEQLDAFDIAIILEDLGKILVRSGAVCSDLVMKQLPVNTVTRISTHLYNTSEEINTLLETLTEIINEMT